MRDRNGIPLEVGDDVVVELEGGGIFEGPIDSFINPDSEDAKAFVKGLSEPVPSEWIAYQEIT